MKHRLFVFAAALALAGCDSQKNTAQEAERQRLEAERQRNEAERVQLAKDKAEVEETRRLAEEKHRKAEQLAIDTEKSALQAEARRLEKERDRLQDGLSKLEKEHQRRRAEKDHLNELEAAEQQAAARLAEQQAAQAMAEARNEKERQALETLKLRAEAARAEAERSLAEAKAREAAAKKAQEEAIKQTTAVFFTALEPLGDWFESDRFGFVWRPYEAAKNSAWRPYVDGRWLYTDAGWTWQSHESFGWAVYHYGRWTRLPQAGWVWVPGSEWAPAWVSWRWHRPREFVGWAPLPPEAQNPKGFNSKVDAEYDIGPGSYTFVALGDFDAPTYAGKILPTERNREILPLTQNITFLAPRPGVGIVAGGPDIGTINSELRRLREDAEIKPFQRTGLQLLNAAASTAAPDVMNAGALMLFAPQLKAIPPVGRPTKLKGKLDVKHAEKGWDPSNPWETDEWRKRLRADAAAADAAERAAAQAAKNPPPAPPRPAPTPQPTPRPAVQPPRPPKPGGMAPTRIEPSSPLFPKK